MSTHLPRPFLRFFSEYRADFTERGWVIKRGFRTVGEPTRFFADVVIRIEQLCAEQKPAPQPHGAPIALLPIALLPTASFASLAPLEA